VKLAKVAQKSSVYDVTHQKPTLPNPKKFFRVQTTRLAESFELLTWSVVLTGLEKFLSKATCDPAVFSQAAWINPGVKVLTLWERAYDYIVFQFRPKTSSFRLPYQRHISSTDYARELFNGSKGSANLLICTQKKYFRWGLRIFCEWPHKWSSFWAILAHVTWARA